MLARPKVILIVGLAKSGKTTMALKLLKKLQGKKVQHLNADAVRQKFNDWDFTPGGRLRQAQRMFSLVDRTYDMTVIDMIAPLQEMRDIIQPDFIIWMDTMQYDVYKGNVAFEKVDHPRMFRIKDYRTANVDFIASVLLRDVMYDHTFYAEV